MVENNNSKYSNCCSVITATMVYVSDLLDLLGHCGDAFDPTTHSKCIQSPRVQGDYMSCADCIIISAHKM